MPIESTSPIDIPEGKDKVAFNMAITARFTPAGIKGAVRIDTQHYRANEDGTNPVEIGKNKVTMIGDVDAEAKKDPEFAKLMGQFLPLMAAYVAAKKL